MANVIIKSDERRADERYTAEQFGVRNYEHSDQREAIEVIAARSRETIKKGSKPEREYYL